MSSQKKLVRQKFRDATFSRDGNKCRVCGCSDKPLDAHHIIDRNEMPNGGYVKENGISLCPPCHEKAEVFHSTGTALDNFSPKDLYDMIGSSEEKARAASEKIA